MPPHPLLSTLQAIHAELASNVNGEVATYIPELGLANPDHFGIAITTVDGHSYGVGNWDVPFTIQSISKPFVYGLALDDAGVDAVLERVGVEPSGDAFNAISLEPGTGRPRNPMINAGAIASAGLVRPTADATPFERIRRMLSLYAGRELDVDEAVFLSEKETGHRNRAIGHLLRNAGIVEGDVDGVCDTYFRQCSVRITCGDLSMMAATLAAGGRNPQTGARAVQVENVERLLSVMSSCGMYDFAGSWLYRIGMPAKSGVGGGVLAVMPGQFGIGVFSPRLDQFGNSVRGVAACERLSAEFGLHLLRPPLSVESVIRGMHPLSQLMSKRQRPPAEVRAIEEAGRSALVVQLQGPLVFSTAEVALRHVLDRAPAGALVVFDLRRVTGMDEPVGRLFAQFAAAARATGGATLFGGVTRGHPAFAFLSRALPPADGQLIEAIDDALERCEQIVLERAGIQEAAAPSSLAGHPLFTSLGTDALEQVAKVAVKREEPAGTVIVRRGAAPEAIYALVAGLVEVALVRPDGSRHRLSTFGPGAMFGELALVDAQPRSADVVARTGVTFYEIPVAALARLEAAGVPLRGQFVQVVAQELARRLRRANTEIEALIA
jgi:glutaminase